MQYFARKPCLQYDSLFLPLLRTIFEVTALLGITFANRWCLGYKNIYLKRCIHLAKLFYEFSKTNLKSLFLSTFVHSVRRWHEANSFPMGNGKDVNGCGNVSQTVKIHTSKIGLFNRVLNGHLSITLSKRRDN